MKKTFNCNRVLLLLSGIFFFAFLVGCNETDEIVPAEPELGNSGKIWTRRCAILEGEQSAWDLWIAELKRRFGAEGEKWDVDSASDGESVCPGSGAPESYYHAAGPKTIRSGQEAEFIFSCYSEVGSVTDIRWDFGVQATIEGQGTPNARVVFYTPTDITRIWKVTFKDVKGNQRELSGSITIYSSQVTINAPEFPARLGEAVEISAHYREAISYEWMILPNTYGIDIVSMTGNTLVFRILEPNGQSIKCRALCSWGYTDWNFNPYQPIIAE